MHDEIRKHAAKWHYRAEWCVCSLLSLVDACVVQRADSALHARP